MSELIKLDANLSAEDNVKKLIKQAAPDLEPAQFELGLPVDAEDDSTTASNTRLPAVLRQENVALNYLIHYDRVKPLEAYGTHTINLSARTKPADFKEQLKTLGLVADQTQIYFNHEQLPNVGHPYTVAIESEQALDNVNFEDVRHYPTLTVRAKPNSLVYRGETTVQLKDSTGYIDIVGWTRNSMPMVNSTARQNFDGLLLGKLTMDTTRVKSISQIETLPFDHESGRNTQATVTYTLENGLQVKDTVVFNRAPLALQGGVTSIVLEEKVFKSGFEGIYDFVNRFISDKLVENTDKSVLENETDAMEFLIEGVTSKEDLAKAIESGEITLRARTNSLVYQGTLKLSISVNPIELKLNGFQTEAPVNAGPVDTEPKEGKEEKQEEHDNHDVEIEEN